MGEEKWEEGVGNVYGYMGWEEGRVREIGKMRE